MDISVAVHGTTRILTDAPFETAYRYADIFRRTAQVSSLIETDHPYLVTELASDAVAGGHLHSH